MRNINEIVTDLQCKKKVFIIGAAFLDVVVKIDKIPKSGEDVQGIYKETVVGGCAFNVADVLYKLNLPFDVFIPAGSGYYGNIVKKALTKNNYPIYELNSDIDNGWCLSLVEYNGDRTFITMSGIENEMCQKWFADFAIADYDYFYLSGYQMENNNGKVLLEVLKQKNKNAKIIFDPGPRGKFIEKDVLHDLLNLNLIFALNETEAKELANVNDVESAGIYLHEISKNPVIITLGKNGAVIVQEDSIEYIEGFKIKVADTIGAGDAHTGGILAGLMSDLSLGESVYLGNKIAAYVTAHVGAACAPTRENLV